MHPALMGSGSYASRAVAATYPAGDVVLLAGFAGFLVSPAWRKPSFWLLLAAVASLLIGDEINGLANSYTAGGGVDATWMLSYVLFGAAALHPSMRELAEPRRAATLRVSTWRIVLLTAAMLSPAAVLLIQYARGDEPRDPGGGDGGGGDLAARHVAADGDRARPRAAAHARARSACRGRGRAVSSSRRRTSACSRPTG